MFYCEDCGKKYKWPMEFYTPRSRGPCEMCKQVAACYDVPSRNLPRIEQELTLALIKPDAVEAGHVGHIISAIEQSTLIIHDLHQGTWSFILAQHFYEVHQGKPFFPDLIKFMGSGPIVSMTLEGPNAVQEWRDMIGPTDPMKADTHTTLRGRYAARDGVMMHNAVHGSDSVESAKSEINLIGTFFTTFGFNSAVDTNNNTNRNKNMTKKTTTTETETTTVKSRRPPRIKHNLKQQNLRGSLMRVTKTVLAGAEGVVIGQELKIGDDGKRKVLLVEIRQLNGNCIKLPRRMFEFSALRPVSRYGYESVG